MSQRSGTGVAPSGGSGTPSHLAGSRRTLISRSAVQPTAAAAGLRGSDSALQPDAVVRAPSANGRYLEQKGPQNNGASLSGVSGSRQSQNSGSDRRSSLPQARSGVSRIIDGNSSSNVSSQSKKSNASIMLPAERAPSRHSASPQAPQQVGPGSRSRVSSSHTTRRSEASIALSLKRAPPSSYRPISDSGRSRSQASSGPRSRSSTHENLPPYGVTSSRRPPSSINTDSLPYSASGSKLSGTGSSTRVGSSSTSSLGLADGPAVELCSCTQPLLTEENVHSREAMVHIAKHVIGTVPTNETALQNKLGLIRHCQHRGISPAEFDLSHWGVCHIEGSTIPNMKDWTIRAQLDHYIKHRAAAEAEAEARDGHNFSALERIATTMGCIDHPHHLELDTIMQGGNPAVALEMLKEFHDRRTGHMYRPGCCGGGDYFGHDDGVVTLSAGRSRAGSSRSFGSGGRNGSRAPSRYSSQSGGGKGSVRSVLSGNSGRSHAPSASSGRMAPSSVWRGGKAETVLPGDSASHVSGRKSTVVGQ